MLTALMPIGDDNEGRIITPYVTIALMAINIIVFVFLQLPSPNDAFTFAYSAIPREIVTGQDIARPIVVGNNMLPHQPGPVPIQLTILTSMFMHGGWAHLFGNMLYLWIFGDNVEDAMGHVKFLAFYILCGILASLTHIMFDQGSVIPSLGASGAIAGVLGGYLLMYPGRSVRVLIGYGAIIPMPALIVIGFWGLVQFMSGFGSIARTEQTAEGGVAYMAHVGGFVAGLVLVSLFRNRDTARRVEERMSYPVGRQRYR